MVNKMARCDRAYFPQKGKMQARSSVSTRKHNERYPLSIRDIIRARKSAYSCVSSHQDVYALFKQI